MSYPLSLSHRKTFIVCEALSNKKWGSSLPCHIVRGPAWDALCSLGKARDDGLSITGFGPDVRIEEKWCHVSNRRVIYHVSVWERSLQNVYLFIYIFF